jgi:hypothetical protein
MTPREIDKLLGHQEPTFMHYMEELILGVGNDDISAALSPNFVGAHWYCIYLKLDEVPPIPNCNDRASQTVQVYRLPKAPRSYQPATRIGRAHVGRMDEEPPLREEQGYIWDFYEFVSRREPRDLGIPYEIVHSDVKLPTYDTSLVERCVEALRSRNVDARRRAARDLAGVGLRHHIAVPALIESMNDSDEEVRREARNSLQIIDPVAAAKSRVR